LVSIVKEELNIGTTLHSICHASNAQGATIVFKSTNPNKSAQRLIQHTLYIANPKL